MSANLSAIPLVISGPIVRHIASDTFTLWMATKESISGHSKHSKTALSLFDSQQNKINLEQDALQINEYRVGDNCFISTLIVRQADLFTCQDVYFYDVEIQQSNGETVTLSKLLCELLYQDQQLFSFKFSCQLTKVLHGSCRKAHFKGADALPQLDNLLSDVINKKKDSDRPDLMFFCGDQVYIDDVAGPMLHAIQQTILLLGLYDESFEGSTIAHSSELFDHPDSFYRREYLLPQTKANEEVSKSFFKGKRKPIFTSVNAHNHLIALNEMIALYLLTWSSRLWPIIKLDKELDNPDFQEQYNQEKKSVINFQQGMAKVERALAHISIYMIFDDHDVTDDWNLTRAWEQQVYLHPFSKRIVGNAVIAYWLFQGIGNPRITWESLLKPAKHFFHSRQFNNHDDLIDAMLAHNHWQYKLDTQPPVQVLDTRTQRWRSESNANKPSGLMDWEGLCALQQDIIGQQSVIVVSAAPVYGVKFIEAIQRVFTTFGGALLVDAENWMAHKGTASVMLNIFRHVTTPPTFFILSGDVHYSFVYDIRLKFRRNSPQIIQFTCSGIRNQFPDKLARWFAQLNHIFYGHRSPLNWLTKRRNMSIKEREPLFEEQTEYSRISKHSKFIVNASSFGVLELKKNGKEKACKLILADGSKVLFKQ